MNENNIATKLDEITEALARIEHQRWAHWQRYMHDQCEQSTDGSLVIPADLAKRWQRQSQTRYEDLTDEEKDSDREQVRRYLPLIAKALSQ